MNESGKLMNGAEILLECLAREGVDCFFGYPGGVPLPFYDALYDSHIRHVLVRHEENACFAAESARRDRLADCLLPEEAGFNLAEYSRVAPVILSPVGFQAA